MAETPKAVRLLVERFEDAWQDGAPVDVGAFLDRDPGAAGLDESQRRTLLIQLVRVDLEYRWRAWGSGRDGDAGEIRLEGYSRRLPALGTPRSWPPELIVAEYVNRRRWGDRPEPGAFLGERFSDRRDELLPLLVASDAVGEPDPPAADADETPPMPRRRADGAAFRREAPAWAGQYPTVRGYEVLSVLGRGGFGVVYKAWQPGYDRLVAVKVLNPSARESPGAAAGFENEARAVSKLDHDHVIKILHIDDSANSLCLVLEYLPGGTLQSRLDAGARLTAEVAARTARCLADALEAAHAAGVIHRDLKPANVLYDAQGRPKIGDFGLAHLAGAEALTASGVRVGTPAYMSPEQAAGRSRHVTAAADVYSLGAVLYAMLTGRPPFQGPEPRVIQQVLSELPEPIGSLAPSVPRDLVTICDRCLEKDPLARFATSAALRDELDRFLVGKPLTIRPSGLAERVVKWARRKPTLATAYTLGVVAVVTLAAAAGALALWRNAESAREALRGQQAETEAARKEAERLRGVAEGQRRKRYDSQYQVATNLLPLLWRDGRQFEIPALLRDLTPALGERDPRGFETHYWERVTNDLRSVPAHRDSILALAVAPRRGLVATAGRDALVKLWDLATGREVRVLRGHCLPLTALAFRGDGRRLASAACDTDRPEPGAEVKVWDVDGGAEAASATVPRGAVLTLVYTHDGTEILSGGLDAGLFGNISGTIKTWDAETLRPVRTVAASRMRVERLALSPDGKALAAAGASAPERPGELAVWDTTTWRNPRRIGRAERGVWGVAFTPDGRRLVSCGVDRKVHVWDVATGREERVLDGHTQPVRQVLVSPDGRTLASAGFDAAIKVWELDTGKERVTLRGHDGFVNGVGFSPDGRTIVSAGIDGVLRYWDGTLGEGYATRIPAQAAEFCRLAFHPDGLSLAWASGRKSGAGEVGLRDLRTGETVLTHRDPGVAFGSVVFRPDGRSMAVGSVVSGRDESGVRVWDLSSLTTRLRVENAGARVSALAYTPDGRMLIGADMAGTVTVWDAETGERRTVLRGHRMHVFALAVSPDGRTLATGGGVAKKPGGELFLWDLGSGRRRREFTGVTEGVTDLAFSPDGRHLAAAGFTETLRVWGVDSGEPVLSLGHVRMAVSVAYSPVGRRIATGDFAGTVSVWEADTGHKLLALDAFTMPVVALAFAPDGLRLAAAAGDGSIKLWDVRPAVPKP